MNEQNSQTFFDYTRLLNYQNKNPNGALEADLKSLEAVLPSSLSQEFSKYKQYSRSFLESGISTSDASSAQTNIILSRLLTLSQSHGANRTLIVAKFLNQVSESKKVAKTLLFTLKSSFSYIFALAVVSVIVFSIITTKVLPHFSHFYSSMGSELPEFTLLAMSLSQYGIIGLVIFCILFAVIFLLIRTINKSIKQLSPLPALLKRFLVNKYSANYHHFLYLHYLKILSFAGVNYQAAKGIADKIANEKLEKQEAILRKQALLDVAYELNALDKELEYQLEDYSDNIALQLVAFRRSLNAGIMAILGIVIGGCLIAVYLPIFGMGSII